MATVAEQWKEEGRREGLEQGLDRGLEQARRDDVRRILLHRFGSVPAELESHLQALDLDALQQAFDAALTAETLEEFRAGLLSAD